MSAIGRGRLEGKAAIVTGAAKHIGRKIARVFASQGAGVIIADVDSAAGETTAREIREQGGEAEFLKTDVSVEADAQAATALAVKRFGRLDAIVNNAAYVPQPMAIATEMTSEDWDITINVCLKSAFLMAKAAIPAMRGGGRGGSIVNISSVNGIITNPRYAAYSAAKAGMLGLTRNLALDFARDRIRVNAICPGMIATEPFRRLSDDETHGARESQPWPDWGQEEDVAFAALFLASDESKFITGATLVVDGGLTIQSPEAILRPSFRQGWREGRMIREADSE